MSTKSGGPLTFGSMASRRGTRLLTASSLGTKQDVQLEIYWRLSGHHILGSEESLLCSRLALPACNGNRTARAALRPDRAHVCSSAFFLRILMLQCFYLVPLHALILPTTFLDAVSCNPPPFLPS